LTQNLAITRWKQFVTGPLGPISKRLMIAVLALAAAVPALSQNGALQQRLAAVQQAMAENQQKLRQYQWIETTQLTLKGDAKAPKQNLCQYVLAGKCRRLQSAPRLNNQAAAG